MRLSTDFAVRFARGGAWIRPWCEVNHRPLDWASRSLSREFEVVIMVERAIGEMVGSDPSSARKITCEPLSAMMSLFNQSVTKQLRGVSVVLRSKCIDTAEIVRD